jgi:hypothetical protein
LIVRVSLGGKGFTLVLGNGRMSLIGKQASYSSSLFGIQHSQRYLLKSHMISASDKRAHSASVMLSGGSALLQLQIAKKAFRVGTFETVIAAAERIQHQ